ncbi:MAG: asparagine synthase-related protein [Planctomycetota bacterium]
MVIRKGALQSSDSGPRPIFSGLAGVIRFEATDSCEEQWKRLVASGCATQPDFISGAEFSIGRYSHRASGREGDGFISGPLVIGFEGRIANRQELCEELGLRFESTSDTQIVHAGFEAWNVAIATRIAGPFVLVILDTKRKSFLAATDPTGLRQLFFHTKPGQIVFSPDVRQVIAGAGIRTLVSREKLCEYLSPVSVIDEGISCPDRSYFDGVSAVPYGSILSISRGREPTLTKYWRPPTTLFNQRMDLQDWANEFRRIFFDVVSGHLHSKYPIGTELSGGVDSGALTCVSQQILRAQAHRNKTCSYTISSEAEELRGEDAKVRSILEWNKEISSRWIHAGKYVEPLELIGSDIRSINTPCRMNLPNAHLAVTTKAANDGCRLLLSGEGADWYLEGSDLIWDSLFLRGDWRTLQKSIAALISRQKKLLVIRYLCRYAIRPLLPNFLSRRSYMKEYYSATAHEELPDLFCDSFRNDLRVLMREQYKCLYDLGAMSCWEQRLEHDLMFPPNHAWQSIPSPVELCLPYLDHRLVEFGLQVPPEAKFSLLQGGSTHYGSRKLLQREGLKGIVPSEVLDCQEKAAYSSPVVSRLNRFLPTVFSPQCDIAVADFEVIQPCKLQAEIDGFLGAKEKAEHPMLPWLDSVLSLELWLRSTF